MNKIFLYLSAFVPLYSLLIIKLLIEILNQNLSFNVLNTCCLITLLIFILLGIYGIHIESKKEIYKLEQIQVIKKESITEQHFLGYFSLFVLFALTFQLEHWSMFIVFLIILVLIGIVYIKNDLFYINPLLNILGYNFYDVTYIDKKGQEQTLKFYYKGKLDTNKNYIAKIGDKNFNYIYNDKK